MKQIFRYLIMVMVCIGLMNVGTISVSAAEFDQPGLYNSSGVLNKTWQELLDSGYITVVDGKITAANTSMSTTLVIDSSVTEIGGSAFKSCKYLKQIIIPDSVTSIGNNAFESCTELTTITIGNGVTIIPYMAFRVCSNLTTVNLGSNVTTISDYAFYQCEKLANIDISRITSIGEYAFSKASFTNVTFSENLTSIGRNAFEYCSKLKKIDLPDSLTNVGIYAFRDCNSLTSVTFGAGMTAISDYMFWCSTGLMDITVPGHIKTIGAMAFQNCYALTVVNLEEGVTEIGDWAFGYTPLTTINIPVSLETVGSQIFDDCQYLKTIVIPKDAKIKLTAGAFGNTKGLEKIYFYNKETLIASGTSNRTIPTNATVYCYSNSTSHSYALNHSLNYVLLDFTTYTVNHYTQNADGTYTLEDTETLDGEVGKATAALNFIHSSADYYTPSVDASYTEIVEEEGATVIDVYYDRMTYALTLTPDSIFDSISGAGTHRWGEEVTISADLKDYYVFDGWYNSSTKISDTENFTFTMPTNTVTLNASATTPEFNVFYELDGGTNNADNPTKVTHYDVITLKDPTKSGYNFIGWSISNSAPVKNLQLNNVIGDVTVEARWELITYNYKVETYLMNVDGTYPTVPYHTENKTTTSLNIEYIPNNIDYYVTPETQNTTINSDGSSVIRLYYERNKYTVTLIGDENVKTLLGAGDYYWGSEVVIEAIPKDGYKLSSWSGDITTVANPYVFAMPKENLTLTANTELKDLHYTVEHYLMDLDGVNYTLDTTQIPQAKAFSEITPEVLDFTGFTAPATQTVTIALDESTVIKYYYTRNKYTITLLGDDGIDTLTGAGTYYYEAPIEISASAKNTHKFVGWCDEDGNLLLTDNPFNATTPAENITLVAKSSMNAYDYTVEIYLMGVDGTYSNTASNTLNKVSALLNFEYIAETIDGYITPANQTITINADGSSVIKLYYERTKFTVTLNGDTGIESTSGSGEYYWGKEITIDAILKEGYDFINWNGTFTANDKSYTFTVPKNNVILTANSGKDIVSYKVNHHLMDLDGVNYTLEDTETLNAEALSSVTPAVKNYTGFTAPITQTVTVNADGSTVIDYYYSRNRYSITLNKDAGIDSVNGAGTYYYGETVNISAVVKTGFDFVNWSGDKTSTDINYSFTVTDNATIKANSNYDAIATNISYTVNYYLMNLDGINYTLDKTVSGTADLDDVLNPEVITYTGFTSPAGQTLTIVIGDNTINYYYTRNQYTLTLDKDAGIDSVSGGGTYYYGEPVDISAVLKNNYIFTNWTGDKTSSNKDYTFTMPAGNISMKANSAVPTVSYTVNHHLMNLDGSNYTLKDTDSYDAEALSSVSPSVKTYIGFTSPVVQTVTVAADGSTVVDYYYTRNQYTVTLEKDNGINSTSGSGTYYYGETIDISAIAKEGFNFVSWSGDITATTSTHSFAMPAMNITITANSNYDTIINNIPYVINYYLMDLNGTTYTLDKTVEKTARLGSSITANVITYTGFTSPTSQTITIEMNGNEVNYYYTRNKYSLDLNKGTGILSVSGEGTYFYGESITINATLENDYNFTSWTNGSVVSTNKNYTFTMPANNLTLTANATKITVVDSSTDKPVITVKNGKATIAAGKVSNDTLDKIYYRINGGNWNVYTGEFNIPMTYTVEAFQTTKGGLTSETAKVNAERTVTVSGRLTYSDGTPVANKLIELRSTPRYVKTDANGYFIYEDVEIGDHTLKIYEGDLGSNISAVVTFHVSENGNNDSIGGKTSDDWIISTSVDSRNNSFVINSTFQNGMSDDIPTIPQTGDSSNLTFYVVLMLVSLISIILLSKKKKYI